MVKREWTTAPSGLWLTSRDRFGEVIYRCMECSKITSGLKHKDKMHHPECSRLKRESKYVR